MYSKLAFNNNCGPYQNIMAACQTTIIYMRHGEKAYANSKGPKGSKAHDPPLVADIHDAIASVGEQVVAAYGIPTHCIVSPFLRTRHTAEHMLSSIRPDLRPDIQVDVNISEYLGNQKPYLGSNGRMTLLPDVDAVTQQFEIPLVGESFSDMNKRCQRHLNTVGIPNLRSRNRSDSVIWVVTHGLVISTISTLIYKHRGQWGIDIPNTKLWPHGPESLEGFILQGNRDAIKVRPIIHVRPPDIPPEPIFADPEVVNDSSVFDADTQYKDGTDISPNNGNTTDTR